MSPRGEMTWIMKQIQRTKIAEALQLKSFGDEVNVKGWVRTRRGNKNVGFVALNDGSTIHNLQVVIDIARFGEEFLKPITTGACINVNGKLVESMGKGQTVEIQATEIEIYGGADPRSEERRVGKEWRSGRQPCRCG